jgi:outer membrane protein assembly factor BamB
MIRRAAVILALAGLAAGCGGAGRDDAAPAAHRPDGKSTPVTRARPKPPKPRRVMVTVLDGDLRRHVKGARVVLGRRSVRTNRRGVAVLKVRRRTSSLVTVRARGYRPATRRLPVGRRPFWRVRIYQPRLQWPIYGATPTRTQAQTRIRLRPPFRVVWSRGIGSLIEFPAVVSDGVAYIGNFYGSVRAISMRTGKVVWRHDTPHGKMAASPAVVGDTIVTHGMDGHVWVLDRRNGRLRWHFTIGSPVESSPIVRRGVDYFGAWNGSVYALDLKRRRVRWVFRDGVKITSSVAIAGRTLFVGDYAGRLVALDARTGSRRWSGSVNGRVYGTPAVSHGRVFVPSSTGGSLTAFSTGGARLWSIGTGSYVYSSPAVWGGRVFFGSYNGVLYCASARSGRILWRVGTGGAISGAAVVVDGVVYAGSFAHRIVGADARSGRVLLRFPHGHYVPVSGNGQRLLLHGYSRLYAVEPRR